MIYTINNFENKEVKNKKKYKLILNEIKGEEKSITGIQKSLEQKGINMHRLVLTGYLDAMVELGILKEREIKPARIFSFYDNDRDIYSVIGNAAKKIDNENSGLYSLIILYQLFDRPIFLREIEKCNVNPLNKNDYIAVIPPLRNDYIKRLEEVGIKIPQSNQIIEPLEKDNNSLVIRLLKELVYNEFDIKKYSVINNNQKTLD